MAIRNNVAVTTTEAEVEFDARYPFMWVRNLGETDCYASVVSGFDVSGVDVALVKAGEVVRVFVPDTVDTKSVYIKTASGSTTVDVHAENESTCPFNRASKGGGGGGTITIDDVPTQGSTNAVSSGGTYTAIQAAKATRTLLYTSGDIATGAPFQTDVNLLDNLNKYDLVMILYVADSSAGSEACGTGIYDVSELLTTGYNAHFAGYFCRWSMVRFTNTTFNQTGRGATNEGDQYAPQIYKIYGYKL